MVQFQFFSKYIVSLTRIYVCVKLLYYSLSKIVQADTNLSKDDLTSKNKVVVKEDFQINSLLTVHNHLIVGGVGEIYAYLWKNLKTSTKNKQVAWTIDIPNQRDVFQRADVNCLISNAENRSIFAGCGDNNIYEFDLERRELIKTISTHEDYIHCLTQL